MHPSHDELMNWKKTWLQLFLVFQEQTIHRLSQKSFAAVLLLSLLCCCCCHCCLCFCFIFFVFVICDEHSLVHFNNFIGVGSLMVVCITATITWGSIKGCEKCEGKCPCCSDFSLFPSFPQQLNCSQLGLAYGADFFCTCTVVVGHTWWTMYTVYIPGA